jgi:hypothetical protein
MLHLNRRPRPDPYCAFKDDKERGLTLRSRHRWSAVAAVALATLAAPGPLVTHAVAWLTKALAP